MITYLYSKSNFFLVQAGISVLKFSISKTEHIQRETHTNRGLHSERKVLSAGVDSHSDETWPYINSLGQRWKAPSLVTAGCRSFSGEQNHWGTVALLALWMAKFQMSDNSTRCSLPSVCERRGIMCNLVKWEADTEASDVPAQPLFHGKHEVELLLTSPEVIDFMLPDRLVISLNMAGSSCTGSITTPNFQACLLLDHTIYTCFQFSFEAINIKPRVIDW